MSTTMALPSKLFKIISNGNKTCFFSTSSRLNSSVGKRLVYDQFGDPKIVVKLEEFEITEPNKDEVVVKMLAAPINPADINTIQGVYPVKTTLPGIPGNEGVGEITAVGGKVKNLKVGDWVIPGLNNWGTWRSHAVCPEKELQKIKSGLDVVGAATISVNPCTAYRMLRDFVDLEPGDVVIQNGANSACGQSVIQLCREWGFTSVNVVRNRPDIDELKARLSALGADHVLTEEELPSVPLFKDGLKKPKLGLNCVGGKSCLNILRHLDNGASLVTYGGMSREPVTVPTSALIFKDITLRGFWMTRWKNENNGSSEHVVMLSEVASLSSSGRLLPPPHELVPLSSFKEALIKSTDISGKTGLKYILDFTN